MLPRPVCEALRNRLAVCSPPGDAPSPLNQLMHSPQGLVQRIQLALLWCRQLPGASLLQEVHLEIATLVVVKRVHIGLQLCLKGLNLRLLFAIGLPPHQGCSTEHHKSAWRAACCWQVSQAAAAELPCYWQCSTELPQSGLGGTACCRLSHCSAAVRLQSWQPKQLS